MPTPKITINNNERDDFPLASLLISNASDNIDDLTTDARTLFSFLTLIVSIKYRCKYGKSFDDQRGKGYINHMPSEIPTDDIVTHRLESTDS